MRKTVLNRILTCFLAIAMVGTMVSASLLRVSAAEPPLEEQLELIATSRYHILRGLENPDIPNLNRPIAYTTDGLADNKYMALSPIVAPAETGDPEVAPAYEWNYFSFTSMLPWRANITVYNYTSEINPLEIGKAYSYAELQAQYPALYTQWSQNPEDYVGHMVGYQWTENIVGSGSNYQMNPAYMTRTAVEDALEALVYDAEGNPIDLPLEAIRNKWIYGWDGAEMAITTMIQNAGLQLADFIG